MLPSQAFVLLETVSNGPKLSETKDMFPLEDSGKWHNSNKKAVRANPGGCVGVELRGIEWNMLLSLNNQRLVSTANQVVLLVVLLLLA